MIDMKSEDVTALATTEDAEVVPTDQALPAVQSMVVFAQHPHEMAEAQDRMIAWARGQEAVLLAELADLEGNLAIAVKNKWRTQTLKRAVSKAKKRVHFYEKVKLALEAGLCMVPNFPTGAFAIRTEKVRPDYYNQLHHWEGQVRVSESENLPAKEGRYVDPQPMIRQVHSVDKEGKRVRMWKADQFEDIGFPFTFVKPQITEAASRAMALKVFDELGCLPERPTRNADPIVVGKVRLKEGYNVKEFTFLVAWFMDLRRM